MLSVWPREGLVMGKTPKPLTIAVSSALEPAAWVDELRAKGHIVEYVDLITRYDLALGPECARFLPGMEKFLEDFIKGARKVKYPKEPK